MGPLTTHVFGLATTAPPGEVWRALTCGDHLHGLGLVSDWKPGSTVEARAGVGPAITCGARCSSPTRPTAWAWSSTPIYLTWEVTPGAVRLSVDEIDGDCDEEAAVVWGPVMAALEARLAAIGRLGPEP